MKQAYRWIPSLYLLEGLPFALVASVAMILYKNLHISNTEITFYTSLFTIPWFLKPIFAPAVEGIFSKRTIVLITSALLIIWILLLTLSLSSIHFFAFSLIIFFCIALTSSIYDMNTDGLYILNLDKKTQAEFIGIRTISYHLGRLIVLGGIVYFASLFFNYTTIKFSWQIAFIILIFILCVFLIYHYFNVPKDNMTLNQKYNLFLNFKNVFSELLLIPNLFHVILFTIIYNFSENQLVKIVPLFLLDHYEHGGLNLTTTDVSILIGGIGIFGMLIGVFISGFLLARFTLKQSLIPITLFACISNIGFLLLSFAPSHSLFLIGCIIFIAQLGYGISNGAYMFYLLHTFGQSIYSMSLYAAGTALMGFSVMLGGAISGYMQYLLSYQGFFTWILLFGVIIIFYCIYIKKKDMINN